MENVVEMRGVSKFFPGIVANDKVNFDLAKGEIHALLGENGAGKSTLMSILFGIYRPDEGKIFVKGHEVEITSPNKAHDLGIGMVHQHFKLVENFTVTQNIMLGRETTKGLFLDQDAARKRVIALSEQYGLNVDPDAKIEDVSVGMQQRVEILKVLYRDADIIILDEPTAVLTPQEIDELMAILRNFCAEGKSVILITHKLKEIMAVADRVTVLRRGKYITTAQTSETSEADLASLMVGRPVSFEIAKAPAKLGETVLSVQDLKVRDARGHLALKGVNLEVKAGEILGLAGVDGNGQSELLEAIAGLSPVEAGQIQLLGQDITNVPIRDRTEQGLAHIPADRQKFGLVLQYSLAENYILTNYYQDPYSIRGFLQKAAISQHAEELSAQFDVRSGEGIRSLAGQLSGGNQQKAIIAREFSSQPKLLLCAQPTRGLDVGAIEYIHNQLVKLRDQGVGILLLSFELDEILSLSDRIVVMYGGQISGEVQGDATNERELGLMMVGSWEK